MIAVLSYLVYETRSLRKDLKAEQAKSDLERKDLATTIEAKENKIRSLELDFRNEISSLGAGLLKAYNEQTEALIKFEGLFRDLFDRDITKIKTDIDTIKNMVSKS